MDRVENLHEDGPDPLVVLLEHDALLDEVEEVAVEEVGDEVEVLLVLADFEQLVDAGDVRDELLDGELAPLVHGVAGRRTSLLDDFDCTAGGARGGGGGVVIDSEVHGAEGTSANGLE